MSMTNGYEASVRRTIILSARRMMVGLETVKREQALIVRYLAALSERGDHGTISRLARNLGVRPQPIYAALSGSKKNRRGRCGEDFQDQNMRHEFQLKRNALRCHRFYRADGKSCGFSWRPWSSFLVFGFGFPSLFRISIGRKHFSTAFEHPWLIADFTIQPLPGDSHSSVGLLPVINPGGGPVKFWWRKTLFYRHANEGG